jgi:hypothetical protein
VEHCTPEQLALAALREPLPAEDAAHLDACDRCRSEVASLQRGVDALSIPEFAAVGAPVPPPPAVWAAITAATGVSATVRDDAADTAAPPVVVVPSPTPVDNVRQLRPRRTRVLLAAAAVAVVAAGAGAIVLNRDEDVVVASTALAPLESGDVSGSAEVVEEDGVRVLRIELDAPAADDAIYEAWLADESAAGMIAMGSVRPGTTSLPVPDSVDLADWPTVEISVEPVDGDPGHSGVSLVRGALRT